jgi:hypothetical protein
MMVKNRKQKHNIRSCAAETTEGYAAVLWRRRQTELSRYTGMPDVNATAHSSYWRRPASSPLNMGTALSAGSPGQMRLEAAVMEQVCRAGGFYWAHPFGVAAVQPEPNGIVLELDDRTIINPRKNRNEQPTMAEFLLHEVLPRCEEGEQDEVSGIPGLRVVTGRGAKARDLELRDVTGPGQVTLRAPAGIDWSRHLGTFDRDLREQGYRPLWVEPEQTLQEAIHRSRLDGLGRHQLASIGSGLLRRINLFYEASTAYTTSSWIGDAWIVEFRTVHGAGHPHAEFLGALTDRIWGMSLEPTWYDCRCGGPAGSWETLCDVEFRSPDRGGLELRFRCRPDTPYDWRISYEQVGAGKGWLNRVLPRQVTESTS